MRKKISVVQNLTTHVVEVTIANMMQMQIFLNINMKMNLYNQPFLFFFCVWYRHVWQNYWSHCAIYQATLNPEDGCDRVSKFQLQARGRAYDFRDVQISINNQ